MYDLYRGRARERESHAIATKLTKLSLASIEEDYGDYEANSEQNARTSHIHSQPNNTKFNVYIIAIHKRTAYGKLIRKIHFNGRRFVFLWLVCRQRQSKTLHKIINNIFQNAESHTYDTNHARHVVHMQWSMSRVFFFPDI